MLSGRERESRIVNSRPSRTWSLAPSDGCRVRAAKECWLESPLGRASGQPKGFVLRPDGSGSAGGGVRGSGEGRGTAAAPSEVLPATVAKYLPGKNFGFVEVAGGANAKAARQVFFHRSKLSGMREGELIAGARVEVRVRKDTQGRMECTMVRAAAGGQEQRGGGGGDEVVENGVTLPCFSMNMPFAGLLAHGIKTIESRNHTMFEGTEVRPPDCIRAYEHTSVRTYVHGYRVDRSLSPLSITPDHHH